METKRCRRDFGGTRILGFVSKLLRMVWLCIWSWSLALNYVFQPAFLDLLTKMTFFGRIWRQKDAGETPGGHQNFSSTEFEQLKVRTYDQSGFLALKYQIGFRKITFRVKNDDFWSNLATLRRRWHAGENVRNSKIIFKCSQYLRLTHHWVFFVKYQLNVLKLTFSLKLRFYTNFIRFRLQNGQKQTRWALKRYFIF